MSEINIKIENNHHRYYTELPNIIFEIGLTPVQMCTYAVIKRAAGERGQCTRSYATLCKMIGVKETCLKKTLKELSEKNIHINKSLIIIRNRLTEHGDRDTNEIIISDIWFDNDTYFQKQTGESLKDPPQSLKDLGVGRQKTQGGSLNDYKEQHLKNNTIKKTTTSNLVAVVFYECLLKDERLTNENREALMKFPEDRVRLSIEFSLAQKASKTLMAQLVWHCQQKSPPEPPKIKRDIRQEIKNKFKNYEIYNGATCYLNDDSIAFERGTTNLPAKFASKSFIQDFKKIIDKFNIPFEFEWEDSKIIKLA